MSEAQLPTHKMYKKILLAVDGSLSAQRATDHALWLAGQSGAEVVVLYVVDTHQAFQVGIHAGNARAELVAEGQQALEKTAQAAAQMGVRVTTLLLEGDPKSTLVDYAAQEDVDCLVVGSHGAGGLESALLGSVSEYCVFHAPCPVLVVRQKTERTGESA